MQGDPFHAPTHRSAGNASRRDALKLLVAAAAGGIATLRSGRISPAIAGQSTAAVTATLPTASFTSVGYTFTGPATVPAGWVHFELINRGPRAHMLGIVTLSDGKTIADLLSDTYADPTGPLPAYVTFHGGPDAVDAGGVSSATVNLQPGDYAVVCTMPDGDTGRTHLVHGMIRPFTVLSTSTQVQPPAAGLNLSAAEFSYNLDMPVVAGLQTIHFHNGGQQQHEAQLAKLPEGVTVDQYLALNDATNAAAGSSAGGSAALPPGVDDYFDVAFTPGRYAFICFATDPATGKAHFELGQILEFRVS
jgi:hypothetical protein